MYSFQPLPTIDTVNSHIGLAAVAVICAVWIIMVALWSLADHDWEHFVKAGIAGPAVLLIIATIISFTTGKITTFENTPVTGVFVGYEAEGYNVQSRKSRADHHLIYVIYRMPEGDILMLAGAGMVYPKEAILYKN